jgi:hypothetical protein
MKEYLSGERFVVGGLKCDWEDDEEEAPIKAIETALEKKTKSESDPLRKKQSLTIFPG